MSSSHIQSSGIKILRSRSVLSKTFNLHLEDICCFGN